MPEYDFHQLSPIDLEGFARDVLQAEWNLRLETFKSGKDRGIDLRYASASGAIVVQCKHYLRTGLSGLLRDLKNKEEPKVKLLKPKRYALVTSVPLSGDDKDKIVQIFGDDILSPSDVFGQDDLNNLLGRHPEVEQRHYKLWLASRAVLDRVIHNAEITRSEFKAKQIYREAKRYVTSEMYKRALAILGESGVVVLSGPQAPVRRRWPTFSYIST